MRKIVAILGPTATGKTKLAVNLCQKFNGEIISVDSRQAYREMEIGTGKLQVKCEDSVVPTHLQDVITPDKQLNAHDFAKLAWEKMEDIWYRDKTPFLVGGTGFYIDVILGRKRLANAGVDLPLRSELEKLSTEDLIERLGRIAPKRLSKIDKNNRYRLIRAIEVAEQDKISNLKYQKHKPKIKDFSSLIVGLTAQNSYLYKVADERVDRMMETGLLGEVKVLSEKYGWEAPGMKTLGYREFKPYFEGKISLEEAVQKSKFNTHSYIRRQKTYFKKYFDDAYWYDTSERGFGEKVENRVESYLIG